MQKACSHSQRELLHFVGTRFQILFTPLAGVLFHLSLTVLFTIGRCLVFSLGRVVLPDSNGVSRVPFYLGYP